MKPFITQLACSANQIRVLSSFGLMLAMCCISTNLRASHIMAGDITYYCIAPNTYSIQLQLYGDCTGIPLDFVSEQITISSASCGVTQSNVTIPLVQGPDIVTPLCPGQPDACNGAGIYGIHRVIYRLIVTFNQSCPDWVISWDNCCRNGAISTLNGAGGQGFYIASTLNNTIGSCNNSPVFLNQPTPFVCAGSTVNFNHGVSELDGDSLHFALVPCRQIVPPSPPTPVTYATGFSGLTPLTTSGGITINPATGSLSFTPTVVQVGVICVRVNEFRNGVKIGEVVRDMQFRVLSCTNNLPQVSGINGTSNAAGNTGSYNLVVCAGDDINFNLQSFDADAANTITMAWNNGIPAATFTVNTATQPPTGTFSWNTTINDDGFYIFTVNMQDNACQVIGVNIFTFTIRVLPAPVVDAGPYVSLCGPSDVANLTGNLNSLDSLYTWSPPIGLTSTNTLATQASPPTTQLYTLTKLYKNGCTAADSVTVEPTSGVVLPSLTNSTLCLGDSVQLDATINTTTNPPVTFNNNTSQPIMDFDTTVSSIQVTGISPGSILNTSMIQSVCINITHGWNDNLDIFLQSPSGTIMALSTDNGGNQDNYINTCFSPSATIPITSGTSPFTGTFLPEGNFSSLLNNNSNGTWSLLVYDDQGFFTGTLNSWSITFVDVTGTLTYTWSPPTDLSCTTCPNPWASPTVPTTYTVVATDFFNCSDTQSVVVDLISALAAPVVTCCSVNNTSLTFCWNAVNGAIGYEYSIDGGLTWNTPSAALAHQITGLALGQSVTIQVRVLSSCPGTPPVGTQTCTTLPCTLDAQLGGSTNVSCNGGSNGTITVTTTGGTAPYTFGIVGFPTQNNGNFTGLPIGTYSIGVTDVNGCTDQINNVVITQPTAITATTTTTPVSCNGGNNGTATVTASGGTGTLTFLWSANANNQTSATATNLAAGTYTVTVTDANNCTTTQTATVTQPTALTRTTSVVHVLCNGAANGQATVTASGGTPPYTYLWSANANNQTTATATGLSGGTYSVTVTDANNCTTLANNITINEATAIALTTNSTQATCNGIPDGSVTVSASGGAGNFTYQWGANANNATTSTVTGLNVGNYNVTVTDGAGCTATTSVAVTTPPAMTLNINSSMVTTCSYFSDGSATVTASGGVGGYTYLWSGGNTPATPTTANLAVGQYFVTVTDANGCSEIDSVTITGPAPIVSNLTSNPVSCNGQSDANAAVAPTGGTGTFTYNWSNGTTLASNPNLPAGQYIVTITDANNCVLLDSVLIIEPDTLQTSAIGTDVSCFGGNDGTATAVVQGGQPPFSFAWTGPVNATTSPATNLSAGTYHLTVTDFGGCTDTASIVINQPATPVSATAVSTPLFCNGDASGTATVTASGGTPNYTYLWDATANNQTTATATNLQAGTYTVTVTDANNCTTTATVIVTEPSSITASMSTTPTSCFGTTDGTATITPSGGVGGFTYSWQPSGGNAPTASNLAAGWHYATVTDANGCIHQDSVEVTQPTAIVLQPTMTPVICNGDPTGTATVAASGGVGGYAYSWSSGATAATATNLAANTYTVTVTDANGCTATTSIAVTEPTVLSVSISNTNVNCFGGNDGTATVTASGGVGNYTYAWSTNPVQTTASANNLAAGNYAVTVTDGNLCSIIDFVTITQPNNQIFTAVSTTPLLCNGDGSGTATVVATGGTPGFTYLWSANAANQTTATATNLQAGVYTVTITDANNCSVTASATVTEPTVITTSTTSTPTSCFGFADGAVTVTAFGGTGTLTYLWSPSNSTSTTVSNLAGGWHYVTVTDANGCTATDSVEILQPAPILTTTSSTAVVCSGDFTGTATVVANGGVSPYTYAWQPSSSTNATATNLGVGWHYVTVTDANGCFTLDSVQVTEPFPLTLTTDTVHVGCFGQATGSATVFPVGGVPGYSYAWSTNPTQTGATALNLAAGSYTVTVTDANACTQTATVQVLQPPTGVSISNIATTEVSCFGGSDATATATATGGTAPYTYFWSPVAQTNATATNLPIGVYTVIVTDVNGCFAIDSAVIEQPSPITLLATNIQGASCFGGNDGSITVAGSGGTPNTNNDYTFVWNTIPQQTGATATNLRGGQTYTVLATDMNGCTQTLSVTVPQPQPVTLTTTTTNISCNGLTDGTATVFAMGGTPGYTFLWDANASSQTTSNAIGLAAGAYTVTVTDFLGCSAATSVVITQPAPLATSTSVEDVSCRGESTGSATALIAGGTAPYYIVWESTVGNQQGSTIENLAAGTYAFTVTDANGCTILGDVTINEPANGVTANNEVRDVTCYEDRDGGIEIFPQGGVPPYEFSLDGQTYTATNRFVGLTAGSYTFYVRDDNGCVYQEDFEITQPNEFTVSLGDDITIELGQSAQLQLTKNNGQSPYVYVWEPANNLSCADCENPTVDSLQDDQYYTVVVTDNRGCVAEDDVFIRLIKPRWVFIANAFTPNNDNNNDALFVQGGDGTFRVVQFRIYDRWGEIVFEAEDTPLNDPTFGWDGTLKGQPMTSSVFAWYAEVEFSDGERILYKGSTVLVR